METYGICLLTLVPVRKSPADKSEMVNQLLFGDLIEIKDNFEGWLLIESIDDGYEGWVDVKQVQKISEETCNQLLTSERYFANDLVNDCILLKDNTPIKLVLGSQLHNLKNDKFIIEDNQFTYTGNFYTADHPKKDIIEKTARKYLNAPYVWGGKSPFGIDCSGFVQMVYKMSGIFLKRDASQQAKQGELINFISEAQLGDLAFFENEENNIVHVGILLNNEHIIHASGKVRIDNIDHNGIYDDKVKKYTHKLRLIKRIIEE
jgi:hypothetical protein